MTAQSCFGGLFPHCHGGIGLEEIGHAPLNRSRTGCDRTSSAASGLNDLLISVGADEWFFGATNGFIARTLSTLPL